MTTELLEEPKSVTFSLRINEDLIEDAKQEARRLSYEEGVDVPYTDLVRQYIVEGLKSGIRPKLPKEEPEWSKFIQYGKRKFWTEERRKAFAKTEISKSLQECIYSNNWCYVVNLGREIFDYVMDNYGIANKVLVSDQEPQPKPWKYERQVANVAWVRSRRGVIPNAIMEQEEILVPGFDVCSNPEISNNDCTPIMLFESLATSVMAVVKEIDQNIIGAIDAAASYRATEHCYGGSLGYHPADPKQYEVKPDMGQIVHVTGSLFPQHITEAIEQIVQHGLVAEHILVRQEDYVKMHLWGKDFLNAPPLKEALKTRNYGDIMGAKILLSDRIKAGKIYILTEADDLGVFINKQKIQIEPKGDPNKLRKGVVVSIEIGILICNDYGIAAVFKDIPLEKSSPKKDAPKKSVPKKPLLKKSAKAKPIMKKSTDKGIGE